MGTVAFVGLGHMGGGMAPNLVRAGHEVRAFDLSETALTEAAAHGCTTTGSAAEACQNADAVVTMLPAAQHVLQVYRESVFPTVPRNAILIDCSTIGVAPAREIESEAAASGLSMVDAPVSGGIAAAAAGTLTFMVGGSDDAFASARHYLEKIGKAVIHAGGAGAGQAAKICNNMLLGATMVATCESLLLARNLGLDPKIFFDIASRSSGQSWSLTSYCPLPGVGPETPADHDYEGGFAAALMMKDLSLAMQAAESVSAQVPMGAQAAALYQRMIAAGSGGKDFSAIINLLEQSHEGDRDR